MIFLKIKNEQDKNRIKKILNNFSLSYTENEKEKYKLCIIDYNISEINKQIAKKSKVIILKKRNRHNDINESILYHKDIYTFYKDNELNEILNYLLRNYKIKKAIYKSIIIITIIVVVSISLFLFFANTKENNTSIKKEKIGKESREIDYKNENIVFLGDSITDFYNMDIYYKNLPVVNSGTSGFRTTDILEHLYDYVYIYNPTKVFLLIGTNDIAFTDITNEDLVKNIAKIISEIKKNRAHSQIYVESIYPVNRNTNNDIVDAEMVGNRKNERIQEINKEIKDLCKEKNIKYINMYDKLTDENGDLNLKYTVDGLHISDEGYKIITKVIMKYIEKEQDNL